MKLSERVEKLATRIRPISFAEVISIAIEIRRLEDELERIKNERKRTNGR